MHMPASTEIVKKYFPLPDLFIFFPLKTRQTQKGRPDLKCVQPAQ